MMDPTSTVGSIISNTSSSITMVDDDSSWLSTTESPSYWNASADWSVETYLSNHYGPKHLSMDVVIPITIVYILIFVSGVVGNVAVCAVIIRNPSMHTATNCYLFSLAVSDLTVLLFGLPNDLSVYWQQYPWALGEVICRLRALIAEMTNYASVLTIVAFSMERYLAICHPLHAYRMAGLSRAAKIVGLIWMVAFVSALPFAIYTSISYAPYPKEAGSQLVGQSIPESAFCAMLDENQPANWPLVEMATFIFFIVPMGILCLLYLRIGIRIRRTSLGRGRNAQAGAVHHCNESQRSSSRKNILRMLVAVVIGFFVCWAPFHSQRLLYVYAKDSPNYREINEKMFFITGCFYYFSSTINPILYNVMSARYREAFRETLCGMVPNRHPSRNFRRNSDRNGTSITSTHMTERRSLKMRTPSTRSNINGGVASPAASINRKHLAGDNNPLKDPAIVSATVVGMADELLTRDASRFQNPLAVLPESEEHPEKSLNLSNTDDCKKVLVTEWRSAPLSSANPRSTFFLMNSKGATAAAAVSLATNGGGSLPAGCTPSCLKSSQLVRRASEASPPPLSTSITSTDEATAAEEDRAMTSPSFPVAIQGECCPLLSKQIDPSLPPTTDQEQEDSSTVAPSKM